MYLLLALEQADTSTSLTSPSQGEQSQSGYDIGSVQERTNGCEATITTSGRAAQVRRSSRASVKDGSPQGACKENLMSVDAHDASSPRRIMDEPRVQERK